MALSEWIYLVACVGHLALCFGVLLRGARNPLALPLGLLSLDLFVWNFAGWAYLMSGAMAWRHVDLGRVWVDYRVRRSLDGPDGLGFGFHTGLGGGLRLQWGEDFIISFDVAHSPTDDNLGIYVGAYHAF